MPTSKIPLKGYTRSVRDSTPAFIPVAEWFPQQSGAPDPEKAGQRTAESFLSCNRGILRDFGIVAEVGFSHGIAGVRIQPSTRIGAFPLISPTSGRPDYGLVIEPRFTWNVAGQMFSAMGFRAVPQLLPLPHPPQSERQIPAWLISSIILPRIHRLINAMQRRFEITSQTLNAPRGSVLWNEYAVNHIALGRSDQVPCVFPDLRDDRELRSALKWVVLRHKNSLMGQRQHGRVIQDLIRECDFLLGKLLGALPAEPCGGLLSRLQRRISINNKVFRDGLQAIEWTAEERGLAGMSDLAGLAWSLDMEIFFEAWVESLAERAARSSGATVKVGRKRETQVPIDWQPPSLGSQRSLLPDIVVEKEDVVLIIDAKYKRHAEEIERSGWHEMNSEIREQHRDDVLQALAYSTVFNARKVVTCLAFPTAAAHWESLNERNRVTAKATIQTGSRVVEIALIAVPLGVKTEPISEIIRSFLN